VYTVKRYRLVFYLEPYLYTALVQVKHKETYIFDIVYCSGNYLI